MKKILFIGWYPNPADKYKNVFFQNLIYAMADMGVDCTVISPVSYMHYKNKIAGIPKACEQKTPNGNSVQVYYPRVLSASSKQIGKYNTERLSESWFESGALAVAKKLAKKGEKFDAVYGHFFLYGGLAAIKIGRMLEIPSYVAFGECDYESQVQQTYGDLTHKDIDGLSGVISVSTKNAKRLDELGIFKNIPVIVAPNSVDQSLFKLLDRNKCREQLNLPKDKFIVGFVGGFIERKGDKRLLEAVNSLDDVYVAFAGRGDNPPSGERVVFCKALEHEKVPLFLNAIDVFVLPTLSEGSCNAIVEAMACELPIISSDLPFNDDALTHENSIRIDPMSVSQIRDAILKLKDYPDFRVGMGKAAYDTAKEFEIMNRAKKILDFMGFSEEK